MAEVNASIQVKGDYGNPSGTGVGGIELYGLPDEAHATLEGRLAAFHAALVTAQLTSTVKCDVKTSYINPDYKNKPGTNTNVDRKIVCTWRKKTETSVRRITIEGVPISSTSIDATDAGDRINDAGRLALATALDTLYGFEAGTAVVLTGTFIQPK